MISSSGNHLVLVALLLVCISSIINAAAAASVGFILYSDNNCNTPLLTASGNAFSTQGVTQTTCTSISGTGITNANYFIANCGSNSGTNLNTVVFYSGTGCPVSQAVATLSGDGSAWGTCANNLGTATQSMKITSCNSAFTFYSSSLVLMLILAISVMLAM